MRGEGVPRETIPYPPLQAHSLGRRHASDDQAVERPDVAIVALHGDGNRISEIRSIIQIANALEPEGTGVILVARHYVRVTLNDELSGSAQPRSAAADLALENLAHAILFLPKDKAGVGVGQNVMFASHEKSGKGGQRAVTSLKRTAIPCSQTVP